MPSSILQIRRSPQAVVSTVVPSEGELAYTTDTKKLSIGDGVTLGGNGIVMDSQLATDTLAGIVEKATDAEAQAATANKFPDAAGVKAYVDQFGLGGNLTYAASANSFSEKIYEVFIPSMGEVAVPLPTNACDVLVTGYTNGTGTVTGFKGRFYKTGGTTWNFQNLHGITGGTNYPSIGVTGNVPVFKNPHPSSPYHFVWKIEAAAQTSGTAVNVFGSNQIVGTVSQSGGLPTGAIIETGYNANGTYIKYADGTMVCNGTITPSLTITTATGSSFVSTVSATITYPATFIATPKSLQVSQYSVNTVWVSLCNPNSTTSGLVSMMSSTSRAAQNYSTTFEAIGRWY